MSSISSVKQTPKQPLDHSLWITHSSPPSNFTLHPWEMYQNVPYSPGVRLWPRRGKWYQSFGPTPRGTTSVTDHKVVLIIPHFRPDWSRPDQTRLNETRLAQTRPDQTRPTHPTTPRPNNISRARYPFNFHFPVQPWFESALEPSVCRYKLYICSGAITSAVNIHNSVPLRNISQWDKPLSSCQTCPLRVNTTKYNSKNYSQVQIHYLSPQRCTLLHLSA